MASEATIGRTVERERVVTVSAWEAVLQASEGKPLIHYRSRCSGFGDSPNARILRRHVILCPVVAVRRRDRPSPLRGNSLMTNR